MKLDVNNLLDAAQRNNNLARCLVGIAIEELNKKLDDPNEKQKLIEEHGTFVTEIAKPFTTKELA